MILRPQLAPAAVVNVGMGGRCRAIGSATHKKGEAKCFGFDCTLALLGRAEARASQSEGACAPSPCKVKRNSVAFRYSTYPKKFLVTICNLWRLIYKVNHQETTAKKGVGDDARAKREANPPLLEPTRIKRYELNVIAT